MPAFRVKLCTNNLNCVDDDDDYDDDVPINPTHSFIRLQYVGRRHKKQQVVAAVFSIPFPPFCGMDDIFVDEVMPALRSRLPKYPHFNDSIRVDFPTALLPKTFSLILLSGVDVGNSWRM